MDRDLHCTDRVVPGGLTPAQQRRLVVLLATGLERLLAERCQDEQSDPMDVPCGPHTSGTTDGPRITGQEEQG